MHRRMICLARSELTKLGCTCNHAIVSPVGDSYNKPGLLAGEHRLKMLNFAFRNDKWVTVSDWELNQSEWKRTVEVFTHFREKEKSEHNAELIYVCGADFLETMAQEDIWSHEDVDWLLSNTSFTVITRDVYDEANLHRLIDSFEVFKKNKDNIIVIPEWFYGAISSTKIRKAIREGYSIACAVDDLVIDYIESNKLYIDQ